jgi:translation initiation factor IF-1
MDCAETKVNQGERMKKFLIGILLICMSSIFLGAQLLNYPVRVAKVRGQVRWSNLAIGPDGVVHVVFSNIDTQQSGNDAFMAVGDIVYITYDGTTASDPWRINNDSDSMQPAIACNNQGKIAVVWSTPKMGGINMRVFDPVAKAWGDVEQVSDYGFNEPTVAIDSKGNIFVAWWYEGGVCLVRGKVNGVWEDPAVLSEGGIRCMKTNVTVAPDDTIWAVWGQRTCYSSNFCEYKTHYSYRTATTDWSENRRVNDTGLSHEIPFIGVGPDLIPYVSWGDVDETEATRIAVARIDFQENPVEYATGFWTQHFPRIAVDQNNKCHLAIQQGGGDYGTGVLYMNNVNGTWQSQMFPGAWTKRGDVRTDLFGNVVVCWGAWFGADGSEVYICSLDPISTKYFYAPQNLSMTIGVTSARKAPGMSVGLSWSANAQNNPKYLKGYNIYVKENSGSYNLLASVTPATVSASFKFTDLTKKRKFAISTVSLAGTESEMVYFQ